ncbi:MAG: alcohol dehydrogenase catalytic domain-containing protein, partial [Mucilaginibacter polytrichastri]|nr:alcohol dehydrogenase catalytic domain-containing protein [Mucilaginibacter polytrichastri]
MQVLTCTQPGQFAYSTAPEPAAEKDTAIIAIKRVGICGTDLHAFEGTQPYFSYPRVLGHELAGEIIDASFAPGFSAGEQVTVIPYLNCGQCIACRNGLTNCCTTLQVLGVHTDGGMANYLQVPAHLLIRSEGLSLDKLALVEPLAIGAHGVRRADLKPGEFVLVAGAGPIGLAVIQFAKLAGAEVIVLDV